MPTPDRIAFTVFGFDVMWYGILVALAIALTVAIICLRAPKHGVTSDKMLNYAIIVVIVGVIGARLYYVAFNWDWYGLDLARIFQLREGGLAIHGGLIFGALALLILCRFWKDHPLNLLDLCFAAVPIGQAVGRWGNYFNQEAHGGPTDLPWAISIQTAPGVFESVHPTFLYESVWCLLLFVFLMFVDSHRKFKGQTFLLYCMLYSVERGLVEGLRTDSLMLFGVLKQAQVLSVIIFIAALIGYVVLNRRADLRKKAKLEKAQSEAPETIEAAKTEPETAVDETAAEKSE
ncbi:MAG: prolipoprotein diacylglyceryl transferase [Clostridiales Family XIII bacterium]|jgi:phosphatidylglycerol:prolipoprotein diacylglycerol transferase|nr:prolipoprotein diacylglyceryl transferase [Clostridiales Family XIII bacterium]